VIDISNPLSPNLVSTVTTPTGVSEIAISGKYAYLAESIGIQVIDISNPTAPVLQGDVHTSTSAPSVAVDEPLVLVADYSSGLTILPAQCLASTPVVLSFLRASGEPNGILLEWATASESEFSGFHVLRSVDPEDGFEPITSRLVTPPSPYRFLDTQVKAGITYYYRLQAVDRSGNTELLGLVKGTAGPLDLHPFLGQTAPNPFVGNTASIPFALSQGGPVKLRILDLSGHQVRLLVDERLERGAQSVTWDGKDDRGSMVASGVYLYDLVAPGVRATRRLVRLR
jgi:hypothetical protein